MKKTTFYCTPQPSHSECSPVPSPRRSRELISPIRQIWPFLYNHWQQSESDVLDWSIRMRSIVLRLPFFVYLWWRWRSLGIVMQIILSFGSEGRGRGGTPFCNCMSFKNLLLHNILLLWCENTTILFVTVISPVLLPFNHCQRIPRRINYPIHSNPYYYR